jgi:hypothetical protein
LESQLRKERVSLTTPAMRLISVLARTHDVVSVALSDLETNEVSVQIQAGWSVVSVRLGELIRAISAIDEGHVDSAKVPDRWTDAGLLGPELDVKISLFECAVAASEKNLSTIVGIVATIVSSLVSFDELGIYAYPIVAYLSLLEVSWLTIASYRCD